MSEQEKTFPFKNWRTLSPELLVMRGQILWDSSQPDGTPRKLLDVSKMNKLGWNASISLEEGLTGVYQDFLRSVKNESLRG